MNPSSLHYDKAYFDWQKRVGEFGGWANLSKFDTFVGAAKRVLDFGCGGGWLLKAISAEEKLGLEINPEARAVAQGLGLRVFNDLSEIPDNYFDLIISNNALEHTIDPFGIIKSLFLKLQAGGLCVFVVPCESIRMGFKPHDINHHLFSWSPMCLGNLFSEAGFEILECKAYRHKWPPGLYRFPLLYTKAAKACGRRLFDIICTVYSFLNRNWTQVRIVAKRGSF